MCKYTIELCSLETCANHTNVITQACKHKTGANPFPHFSTCSTQEETRRSSKLCKSCRISRHAQNMSKRRGIIFSKTIQENELFLPPFPPSPPPPTSSTRSPPPDFAAFNPKIQFGDELFLPEQKQQQQRSENKGSAGSKADSSPLWELPAGVPIHPLRLNPVDKQWNSRSVKRDSSFHAASPAQIPRHFGSVKEKKPEAQAQAPIASPTKNFHPTSFRERKTKQQQQQQQQQNQVFELPTVEVRRAHIPRAKRENFELEAANFLFQGTSHPHTPAPSKISTTKQKQQKQNQTQKQVSPKPIISSPLPYAPPPQRGARKEAAGLMEISLPATSLQQMEASGTNLSGTPELEEQKQAQTCEETLPIQNDSVIPSVRRFSPLRFEGTILEGVLQNAPWKR